MLAFDEREVLGRGQREARRQQPLRRRVAREVEEQRGALERAALLEAAAEELGAVVGHADAGEHDREVARLVAPRRRAAARGSAISTASRSCGSPPPENSGSFWPRTRLFIRSSVVIAGLDEVARHRARDRIDRQSVDRVALARGDRRPAVDHLADAVEHAAEDARREAERQRLADEAHDGVRRATGPTSTPAPRSSSRRGRSPRRGRAARGRRRRAPRPRRTARRRACACRNSSGPSSRVAAPSTVSRIGASRWRACSSANSRSIAACDRGEARKLVVADLLAHPLQRPQARHARDARRDGRPPRPRASARSMKRPMRRIIAPCRAGLQTRSIVGERRSGAGTPR